MKTKNGSASTTARETTLNDMKKIEGFLPAGAIIEKIEQREEFLRFRKVYFFEVFYLLNDELCKSTIKMKGLGKKD